MGSSLSILLLLPVYRLADVNTTQTNLDMLCSLAPRFLAAFFDALVTGRGVDSLSGGLILCGGSTQEACRARLTTMLSDAPSRFTQILPLAVFS